MNITKNTIKETLKNIMVEESEYQIFFKKALEKAGKSIPSMSDEEKKEFFNKIDAAWNAKGEKNEALKGNQHKLDVDGDGEIEASDLAALRAGKKANESHDCGCGCGGVTEGGCGGSVVEGVSPKDMESIKGAVQSASSFMNIGSELKKLGMKYIFATSPMPIYVVQDKGGNRVGIVNKKYATKPDFVHGDTAVGVMESIKLNSVNEIANSKGYKPKDAFGARIIQAIDTNIKESNPKTLKRDGLSNEEILKYGTTFLQVVRNGIKAAFQFKYKIHPDVEFPMKRPKGHYWRFESREDMEKYLKVFLADLKKLDSMIVSYLQKPTLKAQQQICDFWNWDMLVDSSRTGGFADGIMNSDTSKQSFYESVNEEKYTVIDPKGNQKGAGPKMQAAAMAKKLGGEKTGHFVVANKNALKARRALEKFKGDFKNPKLKDMMADLFYESLTEGRAFINAARKAKQEGKTEFEFNGKTYPVTIKESVNEEKYPIAVEKFNKELIKHPMVKKAADFYKKSPAEIVKAVQQRLYSKGDKTGNTKEVYIDFKDTTSGITIKHKMKFNESVESVNEAELPKDGSTIKVGNTRVEIKYVGKNKDHIGFNWKGDGGESNYEETKVSDHKDMNSLINRIKDEIRHQRVVVSKRKTESINEGKKRFNTNYGVGKSKYVVNYHDGVKKHKDGSDFFDVQIFKNQKDLEAFKKALLQKGFVAESVVNEDRNMNVKVKQLLDKELKDLSKGKPNHQFAVMHVLKGALTDANFHSEAKKVPAIFGSKAKYDGDPQGKEDLIDMYEYEIGPKVANICKWDGKDIVDAIGFYVSMTIGRPVGEKVEKLVESINEAISLLQNKK